MNTLSETADEVDACELSRANAIVWIYGLLEYPNALKKGKYNEDNCKFSSLQESASHLDILGPWTRR